MLSKVSFSGAGWRISFHLGVIKFLTKEKLLCNERLIASGSSAGSIAALSLLLNWDMDDLHEKTKIAASRVRYQYGILGGNWTEIISQTISQLAKFDDYSNLYKDLNDRLYINVTRFPLVKELIHRYESNEHVLETMLASQYIPAVCQKMARPGTGLFYLDGSITDNFPDIGSQTLRIGFSMPRAFSNRRAHIEPRERSNIFHTVRPNIRIMDTLFADGQRQAEEFFRIHKNLDSVLI